MSLQQPISSVVALPTFYCFVERRAAKLPDFFLPDAPGVIVLETDFLKEELPLWLDYPVGWTLVDWNRGKSHHGKLEVANLGEYWFIGQRYDDYHTKITKTVVEAFGNVPICARTSQEAMMLAERCNQDVCRLSIGALWLEFASI